MYLPILSMSCVTHSITLHSSQIHSNGMGKPGLTSMIYAMMRETLNLLLAKNKGEDKLTHLHSLISIFLVHCRESVIIKLAIQAKLQYAGCSL